METYYRKRSRKALLPNNNIEYNSSMDTGASDGPFLAKHNIPVAVNDEASDRMINIEAGSIYEIAHTLLPTRTPLHFRSMRVAMVSEKTEINVSARYPSMKSLGAFLSNSENEMYPVLDERFVMGTALASKVLVRQVPSKEFSEKKHLRSFWLVSSSSSSALVDNDDDKKGGCLSELISSNGLIRWGVRRQVRFLGKHCDDLNEVNTKSSSSFVKGDDHEVEKIEKVEKEEESEEDEDEEEDDDDEEEQEEEIDEEDLKRKPYNFRDCARKMKKVKSEDKKGKQKKIVKKENTCRQLMVIKTPKDRWSTERYKSAEKSLLEVMKAKKALANTPILRPELRAEARKKIGDTGLLDHLLKHVSGKIAPGEKERFRRRHNADGQMEYWLESADLVDIRKQAGVIDSYWVPPPGWVPGDSPTQDPTCVKQIKLLKQEILDVKRDVEEMVSKKQLEVQGEVKKLRREIKELISKKKEEEKEKEKEKEEEKKATPEPMEISQELKELATCLLSGKLKLDKNPDSLEKCKEQLVVISDFVKEMQEKIEKLTSKSKEEETSKSNTALMVSRESFGEKEKKQKRKVDEKEEEIVVVVSENTEKAEEKAAKIKRLKSGFRICKPQGTFLWPNMVKPNNVTDDLFIVPTPPSVSSSTASAPPMLPFHHHHPHHHHHHHQHPASPVKPLAERRALSVTVSTTTTTINLNDAPYNNPPPLVMPRLKVTPSDSTCCSSAPSLSNQTGNWLALATPNSNSDESNHL